MAPFENEDQLRSILINSAERVLAGRLQPPIVLVTEFPASDYRSLDLLIIDAAGQISVVKCKINASRTMTRQVIGQVFDYASCLSEMSYGEVDAIFVRKTGSSIVEGLVRAGMEVAPDQFISDSVARNLASGRFQLFVAVDNLGETLKRMVRYINSQSHGGATLLALEFQFIRDDDVEVVLPTTYGGELIDVPPTTDDPPGSDDPKRQLFKKIEHLAPDHAQCARLLWDGMLTRGATVQCSATEESSCSLKIAKVGRTVTPLRFYLRGKTAIPVIAVNFGSLIQVFTPEQVSRFADRLRVVPGLAAYMSDLEQSDYTKYPPIPVKDICASEAHVDQVLAAIDELFTIEIDDSED